MIQYANIKTRNSSKNMNIHVPVGCERLFERDQIVKCEAKNEFMLLIFFHG